MYTNALQNLIVVLALVKRGLFTVWNSNIYIKTGEYPLAKIESVILSKEIRFKVIQIDIFL